MLRAALVWAVLIVVVTEALNVFRALTPAATGRTWIILLLVIALLLAMLMLRRGWREIRGLFVWRPWRLADVCVWGFLAVWLGVLFAIAIVAAPNNFDSMTYRLPRVMHWAANHSINFYPTEVIRQLDRSPLAEWVLLHLYLLTGTDRFFNLLQWFVFVLSLAAVWELTALFTSSRRAQIFAVILTVTTPMAVLQATSTQNNLVAAFLFVCFVFFGLKFSGRETSGSCRWEAAGFCGVALGLSLLTQTTNLLYAVPFALWFAARAFRHLQGKAVPVGALCVCVAVVLFFGHGWRNQQLFHNPLGPKGEPPSRFDPAADRESIAISYGNAKMNVPLFLSNLGRNVAMHLATPVHNFNESAHSMMWHIHEACGMKLDEPLTTLAGCQFMLTADKHEDFAGNLPQGLLFLAALVAWPFRRREVARVLPVYAACILCGWILLSLIVCWQPFHPRVELPLFFLAGPFIAAVLPVDRREWLAAGLSGACIVYAWPYLIDNHRRPMFGEKGVFIQPRQMQYFRDFPEWFQEYYDVVRLIKKSGFKKVALECDSHDFQYPIWPMLRTQTRGNPGFWEVNVTNVSRKLRAPQEPPDAVLVTHGTTGDTLRVGERTYRQVWKGRRLSLFQAEDTLAD